MLLVFGISFEIPLFVIMLNLAGSSRARRWAATGPGSSSAPSSSPPSPRRPPTRSRCCSSAIPMLMLFLIAEVIARLVDRRRGATTPGADVADDEAVAPVTADRDAARRLRPARLAGRGRGHLDLRRHHPQRRLGRRDAWSAPTDAQHPCDLLAVDLAYPAPVVDDAARAPLLTRPGSTARCCSWTATAGRTRRTRHVVHRRHRAGRASPGSPRRSGADPASFSVRLRLGERLASQAH